MAAISSLCNCINSLPDLVYHVQPIPLSDVSVLQLESDSPAMREVPNAPSPRQEGN